MVWKYQTLMGLKLRSCAVCVCMWYVCVRVFLFFFPPPPSLLLHCIWRVGDRISFWTWCSAGLAGHWVPGILLFPSPLCWDCKCVPPCLAFYVFAGNPVVYKYFLEWTVSLVSQTKAFMLLCWLHQWAGGCTANIPWWFWSIKGSKQVHSVFLCLE